MNETENYQALMESLAAAQEDLHAFVASMLSFYKDDIADVVQETNLAFIRRAREFDASRPALPLLIAFAKKQIMLFRERRKAERLIFDEETIESISDAFLRTDSPEQPIYRRLAVCRKRLAAGEQRLIALRYEDGLPPRQIAARLNLPARKVLNELTYIRRKLGECITRLCRLGDAAFEETEYRESPPEKELSGLLDQGAGRKTQMRLVEAVEASPEARETFLEVMLAHVLLERENVSCPAARQVRTLPYGWLAAAAGLALLLGGVWVMRTLREAPPVPPQPAAESRPAPVPVAAAKPQPQPAETIVERKPQTDVASGNREKPAASGIVNQPTAATPPEKDKEKVMNATVAKINTLAATATVAAAMSAYVSPQTALATDDVPVVSNVTFTQPFGTRVLEIGYTLENGPGIVTLDITTNGVSIGDENLTHFIGAANRLVSNGTYTVQWITKEAWPDHTNTQARAVVTAWCTNCPPDYMTANLQSGDIRYYTSSNNVPGGVKAPAYKMDYLLMRKIHAAGNAWDMGAAGKTQVVTLPNDFYIGVFQLTQGQWYRIAGTKPFAFASTFDQYPGRPAEKISYWMARECAVTANSANSAYQYPNAPCTNSFLGLLRAKTGLAFDLPSDAQWEYACRAGTTQGYWNDGSPVQNGNTDANLNRLARYFANTNDANVLLANGTAVVGSYIPNAWGLYDMHGNVWEWCLDWLENNHVYPNGDGAVNTTATAKRMFRGGVYCQDARWCYPEYRGGESPSFQYSGVGFRVAILLP